MSVVAAVGGLGGILCVCVCVCLRVVFRRVLLSLLVLLFSWGSRAFQKPRVVVGVS